MENLFWVFLSYMVNFASSFILKNINTVFPVFSTRQLHERPSFSPCLPLEIAFPRYKVVYGLKSAELLSCSCRRSSCRLTR